MHNLRQTPFIEDSENFHSMFHLLISTKHCIMHYTACSPISKFHPSISTWAFLQCISFRTMKEKKASALLQSSQFFRACRTIHLQWQHSPKEQDNAKWHLNLLIIFQDITASILQMQPWCIHIFHTSHIQEASGCNIPQM